MTPTELYEYLNSVDTKGPVLEYVSKDTGGNYILNKKKGEIFWWSHQGFGFKIDLPLCKRWLMDGEVILRYPSLDENEIWE